MLALSFLGSGHFAFQHNEQEVPGGSAHPWIKNLRREIESFFENRGLTFSQHMNIGEALALLKSGKKVAREGWNAHHILGLQVRDENSMNTLPYVYMVGGEDARDLNRGKRVPWVCSQTDMLAEDWQEVVYVL